ncbi:hypothetical protein MKW98_000339 [Papaver atlanticum]|uniref:Uncharacterized protein n=1 Tax=Papaver atlanticum TaxID=357466 RepID=A0AAD4X8K2_9MAGN|nr:hypothetical protein MKW98_000339 [Papaver atlanticum]
MDQELRDRATEIEESDCKPQLEEFSRKIPHWRNKLTMRRGFGSFVLGLSKKMYELAGVDTPGNSSGSYKDPRIGWMTGFLFTTSFVGLLSLIMIIDYKLAYPTGIAMAVLINGFHTPKAAKTSKKQIRGFAKFFSFSFVWGFFQWFYTGGDTCGFVQFSNFWVASMEEFVRVPSYYLLILIFFFDFRLTCVGAGMICSHLVNLSTLFGAILSWGVMWPLICGLKGEWYPATISESIMNSLSGYKFSTLKFTFHDNILYNSFIAIALILGDGLYNFLKVVYITSKNIKATVKVSSEGNLINRLKIFSDPSAQSLEDLQRDEIFMRNSIPIWVACVGYILLSVVSVIAIPLMFPQLKWFYVIVCYVLAPFLGFCNAYGAGLTDINMAYNYAKVALFVLAAISRRENGVIAGLVGAGLIKAIVSISSDLMQDLKTGHLTHTSTRSMVISQAAGTVIGCIVTPLCFFLYWKAFDIGNPAGEYKAPFALVFRNMGILGVQGFSALPSHCLQHVDPSPSKIGKWVPLPMAMTVPFLVGASFAIGMCIGSLIVYVYEKLEKKKAALMIHVIASGLMCGEGLWMLPSAILGLAKVKPPICMKFVSS